eukprot:COSAG06_NODE_50069_length_321_cov_0.693694_1_plen_22_part_10
MSEDLGVIGLVAGITELCLAER